MLKLLHQILTTIQNELPKALFGAVIPVSQYCWKLWKDRKGETKKRLLREKINDLARFRQVVLPDTPETVIIKNDTEKEYREAIAELAKISDKEATDELAEISVPSSKNRVLRWFLQTTYFISYIAVSVAIVIGTTHYWYLVGVLIWAEVWVGIYIFIKKYRSDLEWGSLTSAPIALINVLFVPQYWTPPSLFGLDAKIRVGIEDFLWAAAVGGISSVVTEILLKEKLSVIRKAARKPNVAPFLVLLITFTTLWFWFPGKVIYDIIIALALGAFVTAFLRPDLILSMLARALSFTVLYIALIQFLLAMYPTFVQRYYNVPNLLGASLDRSLRS